MDILLSEAIQAEMHSRQWSMQTLADKLNVSFAKAQGWYYGDIPDAKDLELICNTLGINLDDIVLDNLNISVTEASKVMNKNPNFVKAMVRNGVFGYTTGNSYHIPRKKFYEYMGLEKSVSVDQVANALYYLIKDTLRGAGK